MIGSRKGTEKRKEEKSKKGWGGEEGGREGKGREERRCVGKEGMNVY